MKGTPLTLDNNVRDLPGHGLDCEAAANPQSPVAARAPANGACKGARSFRVLADTGYAPMLSHCDILQTEIERKFGSGLGSLSRRFSVIRGVLAWWIARQYDFVVSVNHWPGTRWLIFLTAWLGWERRQKIILLEFINYPERPLSRLIFSVWMPLIFRPALRRVLVAAQVMSPVEPAYYSRQLGLPACLFHVVPLSLIEDKVADRDYAASNRVVFASGRGTTDWETLFRAAEGTNWELHVACSKHDRRRIDRLNKRRRAKVKSEIPAAEHARIMATSAVYVMPLRQRPISCGQLRLRNAISAGTPIVCTQSVGLVGYAIHNQTAIVVAPGDYLAVRHEVERLLADPALRQAQAARAREFAAARTASEFGRKIDQFVNLVVSEARPSF